jgi:hypothetical protein
MAEIGVQFPTLSDWAKQFNPDGSQAVVVDLLSQQNEILSDVVWDKANGKTFHRVTQGITLPTVGDIVFNQGNTASYGKDSQYDEPIGSFTTNTIADARLLALGNSEQNLRMRGAKRAAEAMNQAWCQNLFYGNKATKFDGLATRLNSKSGVLADQFVDGGGAGSDNTSIYIVGWGLDKIYSVFPEGMPAGIEHTPMEGKQVITDTVNGGSYPGWIDYWNMWCGLVTADPRYMVRIGNIDVSNIRTLSGAADLITLLIDGVSRLYKRDGVKPVIYAGRSVQTALKKQALNKSNAALSISDAMGQITTSFDGIPIRRVEAILNTEALVS